MTVSNGVVVLTTIAQDLKVPNARIAPISVYFSPMQLLIQSSPRNASLTLP